MKKFTFVLMLAVTWWYTCLAQSPRTRPSAPRLTISRSISIGGSLPGTRQFRPRSSRLFRSGVRPRSRLSSVRVPGTSRRVAGTNVLVPGTSSRFPRVNSRVSGANARSRMANRRVLGANAHGVNSRFPRTNSRFPGMSSRFPGVNSRASGLTSRVPGANNSGPKANPRVSGKANNNTMKTQPISSSAADLPRTKRFRSNSSNTTSTRNRPRVRSGSQTNIQVVPIPAEFNNTIAIPIKISTSGEGRPGIGSSAPIVSISARIGRPDPTIMTRLSSVSRPDQDLTNSRLSGGSRVGQRPSNTRLSGGLRSGHRPPNISSRSRSRQRPSNALRSRSRLSSPLIRSNRLVQKRGHISQGHLPLNKRTHRQRTSSRGGGSQNPPYTQIPVRNKNLSHNRPTRKLNPASSKPRAKKGDVNLNLPSGSKSIGANNGSVNTTRHKKTNSLAGPGDTVPILANPADVYNGTEMIAALTSTLGQYGLDIDGLISLLQQTKAQKQVKTPAETGPGVFNNPAVGSTGMNALMANNKVGPAKSLQTLTDVRNEIWDIARILEGVTTMPTTHAPKALIESTGNHVMDEMILQLLYETFRARQTKPEP